MGFLKFVQWIASVVKNEFNHLDNWIINVICEQRMSLVSCTPEALYLGDLPQIERFLPGFGMEDFHAVFPC